ncbi:hypothetical protein E0S54_04190 [Salmonella enterica subsp. enterica serovar Typhimurium]|nr:hypothetical protein [Salmonella enterica subsp. enterica serovar Typhimurium]
MLEIRLAEPALKILTRRYFGGVSQILAACRKEILRTRFPFVRQNSTYLRRDSRPVLFFSKVSNAIPRIGYPVAQRYPPQPVCRTQALMLMEASDDLFFTCLFYAITLSAVGGSYG